MPNDFNRDLERGKVAEHEICRIIKVTHPLAYVVDGEQSGYDIVVPDVPTMLEVKYDYMVGRTGNYFVETQSNGKSSGISVTKALWWVFVSDTEIVWIATEALRYLIESWGIRLINFDKTCPPKQGYLLPRSRLLFTPYALVGERKTWKICPF
jgi:hypothetical protein